MTHLPFGRTLAASLVAVVATGALLTGSLPAVAVETALSTSSVAAVAASARGVLAPGEQLGRGERLDSPDGASSLVMQTDGNAVVYAADGRPTWASGTEGRGATLRMQADGNIVVYTAEGGPVWASDTSGTPGAELRMQDDGNLVLYRRSGSPAWASSVGGRIEQPRIDTLRRGSTLYPGDRLISTTGRTTAVMQIDGNFVVYGAGGPLWASGTRGDGNVLRLQEDGNAVVSSPTGAPLWASDTAGKPGATMVLREGDLVIADDYGVLWSSAAISPRDSLSPSGFVPSGGQLLSADRRWRAVMQRDGNFVVYGPGGADWATNTSSASGATFSMSVEGRLTVADSLTLWSRGPKPYFGIGQPGIVTPYRLVLQNDGNLVEYDGLGRPVWASRG
ncbi:hypothetical protein HQQ82_13300 [Rathayibacter sp. VKM Ac-2856]|uniref:hypothetical protein n=1 Tax=unclassified Rathayibacter TaxID=2609250 RepID=UPI00156649D5|nr:MULTISPECIES: hypothetical protein [unclassified Rathayibacter]NQX06096.1 hypothetical protein [Rathayibacter sp. VKM Ac-2858]NQX20954.1 hypothetical protein [Rathayibacter sp. VKM Ac-2856]